MLSAMSSPLNYFIVLYGYFLCKKCFLWRSVFHRVVGWSQLLIEFLTWKHGVGMYLGHLTSEPVQDRLEYLDCRRLGKRDAQIHRQITMMFRYWTSASSLHRSGNTENAKDETDSGIWYQCWFEMYSRSVFVRKECLNVQRDTTFTREWFSMQ